MNYNYSHPYGFPPQQTQRGYHQHQDSHHSLLQKGQYPQHQQGQPRHALGESRLPQSLERVLGTITRRAEELGISPSELDDHILGASKDVPGSSAKNVDFDENVNDIEFKQGDQVNKVLSNFGIKKVPKLSRKQMKSKKKRERLRQLKQSMAANCKGVPDCSVESNDSEKDTLGNVQASSARGDDAVDTNVSTADEQAKHQETPNEGVMDDVIQIEDNADPVVIEYVQEELPLDRADPSYAHFRRVAHHFKLMSNSTDTGKGVKKTTRGAPAVAKPRVRDRTQLEEEKEEVIDDDSKNRISKKQLKKLTRLSVAELKQLVLRPDVVEMHDVTARDPKLLVLLKSTRNTVPVPRHWSGKRKYLQGKRGFVKPPFDLPDFIKRTGIMDMRQSLLDKEDHKSLKQKMRERIRPKLGKIEIDYQKLHDAFFKYQTKPRMSIHGDLYYEGKENEIKLKQKKPGHLSDELKAALGMPLGQSNDKIPPPWLIAMQRYGPPPSYPNLKILGLNAPIPEGCSFGYHAGGWGKPPVDEMGRPLYGDVFGCSSVSAGIGGLTFDDVDFHVDKTLWGEIESDEDEDNGDADSDENGSDNDGSGQIVDMTVASRPQHEIELEGSATPSGALSTAPSTLGLETPAASGGYIEIRKRTQQTDIDGSESEQAPPLYHVLAEKPVPTLGAALMASTKVYDLNTAAVSKKPHGKQDNIKSVDIALEPDELEMDSDLLEKRYREKVQIDRCADRQGSSSDESDEDDHASDNKRRKRHAASGIKSSQGGGDKMSSKRRHKNFKF